MITFSEYVDSIDFIENEVIFNEALLDMPEARWYCVQVWPGIEATVVKNIKFALQNEAKDLSQYVARVLNPTEDVIKHKKKRQLRPETKFHPKTGQPLPASERLYDEIPYEEIVQRSIMPGYIYIQMNPEQRVFSFVKSITGVVSFVGDGVRPVPLSDDDVDHILSLTQKHPTTDIPFTKGEFVKVDRGPLSGFSGRVIDTNPKLGTVKIMARVLGTDREIEVQSKDLEKGIK